MPENLPSGSSASFASSSSIPTTRRRFLRWGAGLAGAGVVTAAGARAVLELPVFGGSASDDRLHRMAASPNFVDGHFRNLVPVEVTAGTKSKPRAIVDFLLRDKSSLAPSGPLPADDVDFAAIPDDSLVWFGHSSFWRASRSRSTPSSATHRPYRGSGVPSRRRRPSASTSSPRLISSSSRTTITTIWNTTRSRRFATASRVSCVRSGSGCTWSAGASRPRVFWRRTGGSRSGSKVFA